VIRLAALAAGLALAPSARAQGTGSPHGELPHDCAECHTAEGWTPLTAAPAFRHEKTGFPLETAHAKVSCRGCHGSLVFSRVGTACADCHKDVHHGELGRRCETCHSPKTWSNRSEMFQVHSRTRFPLFSVHATLECEACHRSQQPSEFVNTPSDCGTCHSRDYEEARNPSHVLAGFPRRCEECHGLVSSSWLQASYRHPASYPLRGAHAGARCGACHANAFKGTPRDCVACHRADYDRTRQPDHRAAGMPTRCEGCHGVTSWRPAAFQDHSRTRFPLTGAHLGAECEACHVGGRYAGTARECYACHQADYARTTSPNHAAGGFSTLCQGCHQTSGWRPATAIDHSRTRFPLTGAHQQVECGRCHVAGKYAGTPFDCYSCHQTDFSRASNPSHGGFPTQCQSCHQTSGWRPASFNHTRFPLTGAHQRASCAGCHKNGRYSGTPRDCYSCHQADYNGTNNPNHRTAGFPTQCQSCHQTSAWRPASFNHDGRYFPIYSGEHKGAWQSCSDCHVNPGNSKAFECILCHEHSNRSKVDDDHSEVGGYSYSSPACYRCHPDGSE
jgi:hypothetical protein